MPEKKSQSLGRCPRAERWRGATGSSHPTDRPSERHTRTWEPRTGLVRLTDRPPHLATSVNGSRDVTPKIRKNTEKTENTKPRGRETPGQEQATATYRQNSRERGQHVWALLEKQFSSLFELMRVTRSHSDSRLEPYGGTTGGGSTTGCSGVVPGSPSTAVAPVPDVGNRLYVRRPDAKICASASTLRWMSAEPNITGLQMANKPTSFSAHTNTEQNVVEPSFL